MARSGIWLVQVLDTGPATSQILMPFLLEVLNRLSYQVKLKLTWTLTFCFLKLKSQFFVTAHIWSSMYFTGKQYHNFAEILYLLFSLLSPENNFLQK